MKTQSSNEKEQVMQTVSSLSINETGPVPVGYLIDFIVKAAAAGATHVSLQAVIPYNRVDYIRASLVYYRDQTAAEKQEECRQKEEAAERAAEDWRNWQADLRKREAAGTSYEQFKREQRKMKFIVPIIFIVVFPNMLRKWYNEWRKTSKVNR